MQLQLFQLDPDTTIIEIEEWKVCSELPCLLVSTLGRFKSRKTDKLLACTGRNNGYVNISTLYNGKVCTKLAHRLVALTFIQQVPGALQVNHKNKVRDDNRVSNLEWVTPSQNAKHSKIKG